MPSMYTVPVDLGRIELDYQELTMALRHGFVTTRIAQRDFYGEVDPALELSDIPRLLTVDQTNVQFQVDSISVGSHFEVSPDEGGKIDISEAVAVSANIRPIKGTALAKSAANGTLSKDYKFKLRVLKTTTGHRIVSIDAITQNFDIGEN